MYAVVDEESQRLDRLIGETVEMAQLDSVGLKVNAQPEDVRDVIDAVLLEEQSRLRGRAITVRIPEPLPLVSMDRELVRRVLRHLIENAVKYSYAKSPIEIFVAARDEKLFIHIADLGPGIEESEQPFVFDKFFRGSGQRDRVAGSGMGLAIVKAILIAHGGGIEVKSERDHGSVFTFWLPLSGIA